VQGTESAVYETGEGDLWEDLAIPTEDQIEAVRPDLVLRINKTRIAWVIDVACPWDPLVLEREREKIEKCRPLAVDM